MSKQSPIVYRVIGNGTCIQGVRLVKVNRNGWRRYVVADGGPLDGTEFATRDCWVRTNPIDACLDRVHLVAHRMALNARLIARDDAGSMYRARWSQQCDDDAKEIRAILLQVKMLTKERA